MTMKAAPSTVVVVELLLLLVLATIGLSPSSSLALSSSSSSSVTRSSSQFPPPPIPLPLSAQQEVSSFANVGGTVPESIIEFEKRIGRGSVTATVSAAAGSGISGASDHDSISIAGSNSATTTAATSTTTSSKSHGLPQSDKENYGGPYFWTNSLSANSSMALLERYVSFHNFNDDTSDAYDGAQHHYRQKTRQDPFSLLSSSSGATSSVSTIRNPFSIVSWNILSQKLYDINTVQKYATSNANFKYRFSWEQRLDWIIQTLVETNPDIICLQEVQLEQFKTDLLPRMQQYGYDGAVQGGGEGVQEIKRRKGKGDRAHVVATFWNSARFQPIHDHLARGRTLTSVLQQKTSGSTDDEFSNDGPSLAVINCHLEGHPNQYAARISQIQHAMEDLAKRCLPDGGSNGDSGKKKNKNAKDNYTPKYQHVGPLNMNALLIAGDMNCELQSSACSTYLQIGRVGTKGGLGGVHGTSAMIVPPFLLQSDEAANCLHPILEWGKPIPNEELVKVKPHPFRHNSLLSAYPPSLGEVDPTQHFTYCANPNRPVAGLDQIWYSGHGLTRIGLKQMFVDGIMDGSVGRNGLAGDDFNNADSQELHRESILRTGLPSLYHPSDHLPIGAIMDWNSCENINANNECQLNFDDDNDGYDTVSESSNCQTRNNKVSPRIQCADAGVRQLIVTNDHEPAPHTVKTKSPIMAYAELDMLLVTCPYDTETQRIEVEDIVDNKPDLPSQPNQKPSTEQLRKLSEMRERKKVLLMTASDPVRKVIQRILKLKKQVAAYEEEEQRMMMAMSSS